MSSMIRSAGQYNPSWLEANCGRAQRTPMAAPQRSQAVSQGATQRVRNGFHVLSDQTGGFAVTGTANYRDPFDRSSCESTRY